MTTPPRSIDALQKSSDSLEESQEESLEESLEESAGEISLESHRNLATPLESITT